jgi:hypothetical protein
VDGHNDSPLRFRSGRKCSYLVRQSVHVDLARRTPHRQDARLTRVEQPAPGREAGRVRGSRARGPWSIISHRVEENLLSDLIEVLAASTSRAASLPRFRQHFPRPAAFNHSAWPRNSNLITLCGHATQFSHPSGVARRPNWDPEKNDRCEGTASLDW